MAHIASPHSPDRNFHRWISFTDSEVGLDLLLCSQIAFDLSSLKTAHATPTEKSSPSLVPRHSPVQGPHGHCCRSLRLISFVARPLRPHGMPRWDVPALELTPASSKHRTRLAYPHLRYRAREGVSQGPLPVGWDEPLLCSGCAGVSYYPFVCTARGGGITIRSRFW